MIYNVCIVVFDYIKMKKLSINFMVGFAFIFCSEIAQCKNGEFYGCANFGIQVMMAKTETNAQTLWKDDKYYDDIKISNLNGDNKISYNFAKVFSIGVAKTHKVRKNQTSPVIELAFGYECELNNIVLGTELLFGNTIKNVSFKSKNPDIEGTSSVYKYAYENNKQRKFGTVKMKFYFGQRFKVGYCFSEKINGYFTIGYKLQKRKYETYRHANYQLNGTTDMKSNAYNTKTTKSSTRIIPDVGAGIQYRFSQRIFARLEYNYEFKTRVKLPSDGIAEVNEVNISSSIVKLGLGVRIS